MQSVINPLTGRKIRVNGTVYNKLRNQFFIDDKNNFLAPKPLLNYNNTDVVIENRARDYNKKHHPEYVVQKLTKKKYRVYNPLDLSTKVVVGSKAWNELYKTHNWNGRQFTDQRVESLSGYESSVESRRIHRKTIKQSERFDKLVNNINKRDNVVNSELGYSVVHYDTVDNKMFKEKNGKYKETHDFKLMKTKSGFKVSPKGESNFTDVKNDPLFYNGNDFLSENDFQRYRDNFCNTVVKYIKNGEKENYPQYLIDFKCIIQMSQIHDGESIIDTRMITDNRPAHQRIITAGHEKEWIANYLITVYQQEVERLELEGSGWIYVGNIGFSFTMIPLKVNVGAGIKTPVILGLTVINPCIDDNRCLQRCLILASNGQSIIKARHVCNAKGYSKYWNKPNKNLVFGHSILEIESLVNIQDNKPFVECIENFRALENLLDIYITCYQFNMLDGFDMTSTSQENYEKFTIQPVYPLNTIERTDKTNVYLCILNDIKNETKHFTLVKDPIPFKQHVMDSNSTRNCHNNRKVNCRWCVFSSTKQNVLKHEIKCHPDKVSESEKYILEGSNDSRLKWSNQRYQMYAPVVCYADFESSIDKEGNHKPIMLSVARVSRIPNISTEYKVFRGPNESPRDFVRFIDYLLDTKNSVVNELFDEHNMIVTPEVNEDYYNSKQCPYCGVQLVTKDEMKERINVLKESLPEVIEEQSDIEEKYYYYCDYLQNNYEYNPIDETTLQEMIDNYKKFNNTSIEEYSKMIRRMFELKSLVYEKQATQEQLNEYYNLINDSCNIPFYYEYHTYTEKSLSDMSDEENKSVVKNENNRQKEFQYVYDHYCDEWDNIFYKDYVNYTNLYEKYYQEACEMNKLSCEDVIYDNSTSCNDVIDADVYARNKVSLTYPEKPMDRECYAVLKTNEEMSAKIKETKNIKQDRYDNQQRMKELETKIHCHQATVAEKKEYQLLASTHATNTCVKVRHHAHIAGEYFNGVEMKYYNAGDYICSCCSKCNLQLSFNKTTYKLPVYFHNASRYDNTFIMRILAKYKIVNPKCKLEVIPTAMDKEMLITFNNIDFKDSYKMISNSLKNIVRQILGSDLNNYPVTKQLLKQYLIDHNKHYDDSYIELMTRKEPMFYNLITSYNTLKNQRMPKINKCYDELSNTFMSQEDYNHMKLLWDTFHIQTWSEYYELYNILDVTLLADSFEHFRNSTFKTFNVDPAHYITTPQMSYSLFLKNISNEDTSRFEEQANKWTKYQMKISANEGHTEQEMHDIFMKRMSEFHECGGIRLLSNKDMDAFLSLKSNLRGGLTQITTRYATSEESEDDSIFYLDANNLYGGVMHRMMPYDIVYNTKDDWKNIRTMNPNEWILSLDTFDKYGYFIECDIECDKKDFDKFNDLPLFPTQRVGEYSPYMKEFAKKYDLADMLNENDKTEKLICDLLPKNHYVVHYSMLQLGVKLGYRVTKIHNIIKFKQAPFIFEYVNQLSELRAKSKTAVLKNLFKLLANSIYGKFVETGLKRMKVKIAMNKKEQNAIISKYTIDLIDGMELYDDNIWIAKLFNPVKRMMKPFFIGFAILDMSKYIIYDFYYNKLKTTFNNVTLLGQDTDSLIIKITDNNTINKMLDNYKSFDFSELDTSSFFYKKLVDYYKQHYDENSNFPTLESFVNYNKKVAGPIFKDEHQGNRILEFCGLRPKLYCILDERSIIHNAAKGVPRSVTDADNNSINIKNIEMYKRILFPEKKQDAVLTGSFKRIANSKMSIRTETQSKVLFTCLDNKRYVCEDAIHTKAFGYY